ncbi:hypothetical protein LUCX_279 [Xanthomonas phage vB_XciM_LucasX]|nr:hypothetical protein LUCX_279 [Xanthomonas phage vB_XciM_LucasX]
MKLSIAAKIRRELKSTMILISLLMSGLAQFRELLGHWFFHHTSYRRRPGYVEFNVEEELADGLIRFRVFDEYKTQHIHAIPFRVSNRWLVRNPKRIPNLVLWHIKAAAETQEGLKAVNVLWGQYNWNRQCLETFNLNQLPSWEEIERRHAFRNKVHALLVRWFPARDTTPRLSMADVADDIIIRHIKV